MATPVFHITHVENLAGIASRGLLCDTRMSGDGSHVRNIAYQDLKAQRAATAVTCPPGGTLADYVPFYFAPRSPMLFTIYKGNVSGAEGQQKKIVHLVLSAEALFAAQPCAFTDGHAIMALSNFYNDLQDLDQIDWAVMKERYWSQDGTGEMRRKRQAEFLALDHVEWAHVQGVGVYDDDCRSFVQECLSGVAHQPKVVVRRDWYY